MHVFCAVRSEGLAFHVAWNMYCRGHNDVQLAYSFCPDLLDDLTWSI